MPRAETRWHPYMDYILPLLCTQKLIMLYTVVFNSVLFQCHSVPANDTVQSLIESLVEQKRLKPSHFQMLLQESVVKLNLSAAPNTSLSDSVLKVIEMRCPVSLTLMLFF